MVLIVAARFIKAVTRAVVDHSVPEVRGMRVLEAARLDIAGVLRVSEVHRCLELAEVAHRIALGLRGLFDRVHDTVEDGAVCGVDRGLAGRHNTRPPVRRVHRLRGPLAVGAAVGATAGTAAGRTVGAHDQGALRARDAPVDKSPGIRRVVRSVNSHDHLQRIRQALRPVATVPQRHVVVGQRVVVNRPSRRPGVHQRFRDRVRGALVRRGHHDVRGVVRRGAVGPTDRVDRGGIDGIVWRHAREENTRVVDLSVVGERRVHVGLEPKVLVGRRSAADNHDRVLGLQHVRALAGLLARARRDGGGRDRRAAFADGGVPVQAATKVRVRVTRLLVEEERAVRAVRVRDRADRRKLQGAARDAEALLGEALLGAEGPLEAREEGGVALAEQAGSELRVVQKVFGSSGRGFSRDVREAWCSAVEHGRRRVRKRLGLALGLVAGGRVRPRDDGGHQRAPQPTGHPGAGRHSCFGTLPATPCGAS
mmetsp:Transcript_28047/g.75970  ORF Transcript_28047/g.75970 Transcript_28047/m.75970 type:complete len:480 (+) Transcript_28047:962-2401(+)